MKHGKHYKTYNVVTGKGKYLTTGIREISSGNTETQMDVLIYIFILLEESLNKAESDVSEKIVSSRKNVMSDRQIVQKIFNSVFQEYRSSVLPGVVKGWDLTNKESQKNVSRINEFFCGFHFLTGLERIGCVVI